MATLASGPCLTLQDLAAKVSEAIDGLNGETPLVSVGTVTVLTAGEAPYVTDSGDATASPPTVVLNFGLPSGGVDGDDGDDGATPIVVIGTVSPLAYGQLPTVVANPITVPSVGVSLDFGIPAGAPGDDGETPEITVNSTTTLAAGMDATVVATPTTPPAATGILLDFGIPKGADGTGGSGSAYQKPDILVTYDGGANSTIIDSFQTNDDTIEPGSPGTSIPVSSSEYGADALSGQTWNASYSITDDEYQLTHETVSLKMLIATPTADVSPDDATFTSTSFSVAHGRLPVGSGGNVVSTITIKNRGRVSLDSSAGDEIGIYHDRTAGSDESDQWSTVPEAQEMSVVVVTQGVGAATAVTGAGVTAAKALGVLMTKNGEASYTDAGVPNVTVVNVSKTAIGAEPVALACDLQPDGTYLICSVMDFRGGPGFDADKKQVWVHDASGNENFELVSFCYDEQYLTEVLAGTPAGGNYSIYYKRIVHSDCTDEDVNVIDIGTCETPTAAALATGWEATSFWN